MSEDYQQGQTEPSNIVIAEEREERLGKIWNLKMRGASVSAIANALGVSVQTIYRDLKTIGQKYRDELVQLDPMTLVAENMRWLDAMEQIALHEVATSAKKNHKVVDQKTGEVVEIEVVDPNKSRFYSSALKAREMKLRLLLDTGVIPKDNPEKMFDSMRAYEQHEAEIEDETRTPEQVRESIEKLLTHGRRME